MHACAGLGSDPQSLNTPKSSGSDPVSEGSQNRTDSPMRSPPPVLGDAAPMLVSSCLRVCVSARPRIHGADWAQIRIKLKEMAPVVFSRKNAVRSKKSKSTSQLNLRIKRKRKKERGKKKAAGAGRIMKNSRVPVFGTLFGPEVALNQCTMRISVPGASHQWEDPIGRSTRLKEDNPSLIMQHESPGPGQPASAQRRYPQLLTTPGVPASATLSLCLGETRLGIQADGVNWIRVPQSN
ncbi:Unconventional Myosin-Ic [Manis pentadactyla]|nr:Unconventional Myosin-Ic [Manis pentadactyla]